MSTMRSFLLTVLVASSIFSSIESKKPQESRLLRGETTDTTLLSTPFTQRELREDNEYLDAVRNREEYEEILENGGSANNNQRIVGGDQAAQGEYPYYVEMGGCGGALVAPDVVLFAAHCGDWSNKEVIVGGYETRRLTADAQSRFCVEWIGDEDYVSSTTNSDFALCKLDRPVETDSAVILELNEDDSFLEGGDMLTVVGLGTLESGGGSPKFLQEVDVPVVTNEDCNNAYWNGAITERMMCAGLLGVGGKDSCQGDSGGPIVKKITGPDGSEVHVHVGVVSWGSGCALASKPGVYARTSSRIDWIKEKMCDDLQSVADFCDNDPPEPSCDGIELSVGIGTDNYGRETSWKLYNADHELMAERKYLVNFHKSEVTVCLPRAATCYDVEIKDSYGDGMCYNGECGSYKIALDGVDVIVGDPNFEQSETQQICTEATENTEVPTQFPTQFPTVSAEPTATVTTDGPSDSPTESPTDSPTESPTDSPTESPTDSPTESPTQSPTQSPTPAEQVCTLENDSTFRWKNKSNKNCWKFIKGNNVKKMIKKCNKWQGGKRVHEWCPQRCGFIAGVGQCDFLLAQRSLKNKNGAATTDETEDKKKDDKKKGKPGKKKKDEWKHLFE